MTGTLCRRAAEAFGLVDDDQVRGAALLRHGRDRPGERGRLLPQIGRLSGRVEGERVGDVVRAGIDQEDVVGADLAGGEEIARALPLHRGVTFLPLIASLGLGRVGAGSCILASRINDPSLM